MDGAYGAEASTIDQRIQAEWLGTSEMAGRVRAFDWGATSVGALERWPASLQTAASICLHSPVQMAIYWGPELICLYNDAEREVMGRLHPRALGQPARTLLRDSWDVVGPQLAAVVDHRRPTLAVDAKLAFERRDRLEAAYFTYSYNPIVEVDGSVGGVLLITEETTARVLAARHAALLRRIAEVEAESPEEACAAAAAVLNGSADVPLAAVRLGETVAAPTLVAGAEHLGSPAPERALLVPFADGLLVAGINDERDLDAAYERQLEELAAQIARSVAAARVRQAERRHARALAELDAAKAALFSNASHELRTPLSIILGSLEQAAEDTGQSSLTHRRLAVARRNAIRMLKLVNALLDFSHLESGAHAGAFEATDLSALTASLTAMFRSPADLAGLELTCDCPALGEPVYVDRDAWETILGNLLSNALKFTPAGSIAVSTALAGEHAVLTIADTGIGIAPSQLEHIFSRFRRVSDPRARSREGVGIGLALVRELVLLHGGTIEARSEPDRGTRMIVRIPRGRPAANVVERSHDGGTGATAALFVEDAGGWMTPARSETRDHRRDGGRVLVVDDNDDMRDFVRQLLEPSFRVETVADGEAALRSATTSPPDVIVSDVMMPGLDGLGLVRALRAVAATRDVPIVLLSARDGDELEALRLGVDEYLVKPIGARELAARVRSTVALARMRREAAETRGRLEERTRSEGELRALLDDLRAAQRRVVTAADAERRRIERNLHDGAQQRLVAARIRLGTLRVDDDARADLELLQAELGRSLDELRELAHGLFPSLLVGEGLAAALSAAARDAGLPVVVRADDVGRFEPELEAAVYFTCLEALQNAAKHAGPGAGARVRVQRRGTLLTFTIADDGAGFDPALVADGYGLTNVRDRLAALGGAVEIESAPGRGTVVRGRLPLA